MTLYEQWCEGDYGFILNLRFNLSKHTCTEQVEFDELSYPIIEDTTDWIRDVRALYEAYANCIPPVGRRPINFIPANLKYVSALHLSENFEQARVALESYIYLHYIKGDIVWPDANRFFIRIARNCVITRKMLIKE